MLSLINTIKIPLKHAAFVSDNKTEKNALLLYTINIFALMNYFCYFKINQSFNMNLTNLFTYKLRKKNI